MRIKKFFNITFVFLKKNKELLHKSVLRIGSTHQTTTEQDFGPALCIKTAGHQNSGQESESGPPGQNIPLAGVEYSSEDQLACCSILNQKGVPALQFASRMEYLRALPAMHRIIHSVSMFLIPCVRNLR